jgi:mono/diheme cytochrome c family protein
MAAAPCLFFNRLKAGYQRRGRLKAGHQLPLLLLAGSLQAEPLVTGFERFHTGDPTAEAGALLYNELGCANCHGDRTGLPKRQGPVLDGTRVRVNAEWLVEFLSSPQGSKPGTMMPAFFEGMDEREKSAQVEALTHYLMSLKPSGPAPKPKAPRHANAERGSARYHQVGCVACHAPTPDFHPAHGAPKEDEFSSRPVPFPDLTKKYSLLTLAAFLENPALVRPDGRMPHLGLNLDDAVDIACHLFDYRPSDPRDAPGLAEFKINNARAQRGAEIAEKMNCAACHTLTPEHKPVSVSLTKNQDGCLSAAPAAGRPHYDLSDRQRAALAAFLAGPEKPVLTPGQQTHLTLQAFNCYACHDRDGIGGPDVARDRYFTGDEGIADAGRQAPPLTGIGQKLRGDWLEAVFRGQGRARPYVMTQMPQYPAHAKALTAMLKKSDKKELPPLQPDGDVEAGRKLAGVAGGLNCITCHVWGDKPSLGIQALDISNLDKRLAPEWFRDYMLNPQGYRPGTLMPPLWPGGQSMLKDVHGGDTERQLASLWAFIKKGEGLPDGYPDHLPNAFELIPRDRPIIQRAFLNEVGPQAILAGFPGGIHIAYDGDKGRPALVWRGRFFDAYSTWFVRAAPFEDPLEKEVFAWPKVSESEAAGYRGYRLDADGNPIFLTRMDGVEVNDHFRVSDGKLHRYLSWAAGQKEPAWTHPEGLEVTLPESDAPNRRHFVYSWK